MTIRDLFGARKRTYVAFLALGLVAFVASLVGVDLLGGMAGYRYNSRTAGLRLAEFFVTHMPILALFALLLVGLIRKRLAAPISFLTGICLGYVSLIVYLIAAPVIADRLNRLPFDSASWKNIELVRSDNPIRLRMVNDLLKKHRLRGMSLSEVENILGAPDVTPYFHDYDYVYWLGPTRGIPIDSEWLGLRFRNHKVVEVTILYD